MAAASLTDILPIVGERWAEREGTSPPTFRFDATSRLATQLEAGADADVFFSADTLWLDRLETAGLIALASRVDLLSNRLVVVVPGDAAAVPVEIGEVARARHIALAGAAVPAGRYARASLESLGVWNDVAARVVEGESVRTVLQWVARGEVDAGIVYATDARAEPRVRVALELPADSHPPVVYPVAVVASSTRRALAERFVGFCAGPIARGIFLDAGFTVS
jgi:molybdate transport system substrate-binding protein